ncbi:hypothetical protein RSSM_04289 [Rhodopirellula sallentina SM41]|uniref:Uncharacterized protein n=1 Tax=Rhodopirellula sallentina SM41 TaxID=1263870 RepID=M5UE73_9BACT|nr:hypothetical protein RSSM_04289 [Rhodopirellula sallentina SM41]
MPLEIRVAPVAKVAKTFGVSQDPPKLLAVCRFNRESTCFRLTAIPFNEAPGYGVFV